MAHHLAKSKVVTHAITGDEVSPSTTPQRKVAFVLNGVLDDWLAELGLTLNDFCNSMMGSWVFGYASVLKSVGVETVIIAVARVAEPTFRVHRPTGSRVWLLPPSLKTGRILARVKWITSICFPRRMAERIIGVLSVYLNAPVPGLTKALVREQCTVLVVQEYDTTRFDFCALQGLLKGWAVFGTFTGGLPKPWWLRICRSAAIRACRGLLVCSSSELNRVKSTYKLPHEKTLKLHYSVDRKVWFPEDRKIARRKVNLQQQTTIAIYHGSINLYTKGLDVLLKAWERALPSEQPDQFLLLIIGDGKDAPDLQTKISQLGRRDVILIRKWIEDRSLMRQYLSSASFYVFPSRTDAFGIAVLEAMACGLPVLAARARGIPDIFPTGEGSGALIVEPGDVCALSMGLHRMLFDSSLRQKLSRRASDRIGSDDFSPLVGRKLERYLFGPRPTLQ